MVPSDYRLDSVVRRLIERLEGARPTHSDPDAARQAFRQIAEQHVEAAVAEYRAVAPEDPSSHAAFLRREVLETALPRYAELAIRMTSRERGGYGFGWLAGPIGMPALGLVAILGFWLVLRRMLGFWEVWPLVALDASLPFWPLAAAWLYVRSYRSELYALCGDMARIQDAERAFLTADQLSAAREMEQPTRTSRAREIERG